MEARERFIEKCESMCMIDDPDEIIELVSLFLEEEARLIKKTEPYAVNTIREYENAARVVYTMLD